jgi:exosortase A-associated hydrolase 2
VSDARNRIEPFFLPVDSGVRFCLLRRPPNDVAIRGGLLYVHPFAEEMNKSRRMASIQSRLFAEAGYMVLQPDLYGCGDSDGDFADARWEIWKRDIEVARDWLAGAQPGPVRLWGLRLGASLAAEVAGQSAEPFELLLWQPVINGEAFLTQFLRQRIANEMLQGGGRGGTNEMRARLAEGESIEVSGYMLASSLAAAIDAVRLTHSARAGRRVDWFEVVGEMAEDATPVARQARDQLRELGMDVRFHMPRGAPFWATVEIAECPSLLEATLAAVVESP